MSAAAPARTARNHCLVSPFAPMRMVGSTAFIALENAATSSPYRVGPGFAPMYVSRQVSLPISQYLMP